MACREIQPPDFELPIQGYALDGTVTTTNGVPVEGVEVKLYYDKALVSVDPTDTQQVIVTDPSKPVDIAVYTTDYQLVQQLFLGYQPAGVLPRWPWSGHDDQGNLVPSGKYLLRYVVDTVIVKFSPLIVEGHPTAVTDGLGHFTISGARLPIGERFDLFDQYDRYVATYQVMPSIDVFLRKADVRIGYGPIGLTKDRITRKVFTLQ